jgi:hypothetical protein
MKTNLTAVLFFTSLVFFSCKDNPSGNYGYIQSADYLGRDRSVYQDHFAMVDSLGDTLSNFYETITLYLSTENQQIGEYPVSLKILAQADPVSSSDSIVFAGSSGSNWYATTNDTVYAFAYQGIGPSLAFPKRGSNLKWQTSFNFDIPYAVQKYLEIKNFDPDSIYLSEQKRAVYSLPLFVGKQWQCFKSNYWFQRVRKVEGIENVTTKAGTFQCYKIRSSLIGDDFSPNEIWYDYISKEGIILRTLQIIVEITTVENPDGLGRATVSERLELVSLK